MARTFARASSHRIQAPLGNMGFAFNPGTLAFIARKASDPAAYAVPVAPGQSDGTTWFVWTKASTDLAFWSSNEDTIAPFGWAAADGWCLIAASRASGAGARVVRFHKYVFSTNTWSHQDSAAASSTNGGAPAVHVNVGCEESSVGAFDGFFDGDIAVVGAWDVQLTDAQIEALAFTLQPWFQVNPRGLWLLDQSATGQKVVDFSGGGANESAISGTTVATSSVPIFNITDGVWIPTIVAPAGGPVTETPGRGGAIANGAAPTAAATTTFGAALGAGTAPAAAVAATIAASVAGGTGAPARVALAAGSSTGGGTSPSDSSSTSDAVGVGGAAGAGIAPNARITVTFASSAGGGTAPVVSTSTPVGGGVGVGLGPVAATTTPVGASTGAGTTATVRASFTAGAAIAGGQLADPLGVPVVAFFDQPTPTGGFDQPTGTPAFFDQPTPTNGSFDG